MKKILIAYFSLKGETYVDGRIENRPIGNTEVIARKIEELTGGKLFHIETAEAYPKNHMDTIEAAKQELRHDARPALAAAVNDMDCYDTIVLGYPNWWGTMPMAVFHFLESYDFSGKTIVPFCTHEGSGLSHSVADIERLCPQTRILSGTAIRGGEVARADNKVKQIVKTLKNQRYYD